MYFKRLGFDVGSRVCNLKPYFSYLRFRDPSFQRVRGFWSKIEGRGSLEQNRGYRTPDHNRGRVAGAK